MGALGGQSTEILRQVDAHTALVDDQGKPIAILVANHAIHCDKSEQSLLAEDQLEFSGVEVYSRAKVFNGRQCILAKHPETGKPFHIDLGWDGSTKFLNT